MREVFQHLFMEKRKREDSLGGEGLDSGNLVREPLQPGGNLGNFGKADRMAHPVVNPASFSPPSQRHDPIEAALSDAVGNDRIFGPVDHEKGGRTVDKPKLR